MTVKNWYYVLDRYRRWNIVADSLKWFQKNRELKLFAFVFMINHVHLITKTGNTIGFIRDFKKFTAGKILKNISAREPRVAALFKKEGGGYTFWEKTNMPEWIESDTFLLQKINYIHNNPVKRGYVLKAEDWYWSSANSACELRINDLPL